MRCPLNKKNANEILFGMLNRILVFENQMALYALFGDNCPQIVCWAFHPDKRIYRTNFVL